MKLKEKIKAGQQTVADFRRRESKLEMEGGEDRPKYVCRWTDG